MHFTGGDDNGSRIGTELRTMDISGTDHTAAGYSSPSPRRPNRMGGARSPTARSPRSFAVVSSVSGPSIVTKNGMEIPILPFNLLPKEPKIYKPRDSESDNSSSSESEQNVNETTHWKKKGYRRRRHSLGAVDHEHVAAISTSRNRRAYTTTANTTTTSTTNTAGREVRVSSLPPSFVTRGVTSKEGTKGSKKGQPPLL